MNNRFLQRIRLAVSNLFDTSSFILPSRSSSARPVSEVIPVPRKHTSDIHLIKFAGIGDRRIKEYKVDQFNLISGIEYCEALEFQNERTYRTIRNQCIRASTNGYIDEERKWLGALHSEQIRNHYMADVSIRWIDETLGYGLFAEQEIKAWEFIGEYTGVVRRHRGIFENVNDYCFLYPTSLFYFGKHIIDGFQKGNEIRFANHSDDPNSESISLFCDDLFHMILRAVRDIPPNTQITYDYGERYWKKRRRVTNA